MRVIVALSGGKASAWCANYALTRYPKEDVILYFNDTKWEHPDLYRFLKDLSACFDHPITEDTDGRSPEDLFYEHHALANNRMPFCSRTLKEERLEHYLKPNDILIFGISHDEVHRAHRIAKRYKQLGAKTNRPVSIKFPIITEDISKADIDNWLKSTGVEKPFLYKLGFLHNNCSGGCVRAGKKQWKMLYEKLPEVYADRERVEREFRQHFKRDVHFFKDETLEHFRHRIENKQLNAYYYK